MNEELQSTNEELESVNDALRRRGYEVDKANAFLGSILSSLRAGVVVVNTELIVVEWNRRAEDLWGVRAEEARGQHILNIDIGLPVHELAQPLRECIQGGSDEYSQLVSATNRRGRSIVCRVGITGIRLPDGTSTGAVLAMEEPVDDEDEEKARLASPSD